MSIITITSDFGCKDSYVSSIKARLLSENKDVTIVDVSHEIKPFNVKEGFFVLNNVFRDFPKNAVHLFLVNEGGLNNDHDIYVFRLEGHYFVCTGRSLLLLLNNEPDSVVTVPMEEKSSFASLHKHTELALKLLNNTPLEQLGEPAAFEKPSLSTGVLTGSNSIVGSILHIDRYGNAVTNISRSEFDQTREGRRFEISFGRERIGKISRAYHEVENGDAVCLFNNMDLLELGLSFGHAARLMGLNVDDKVKIEFS